MSEPIPSLPAALNQFAILLDSAVVGYIQAYEVLEPQYYHAGMDLFLDPGAGKPLSTQLYEQLRDAITAGRLYPGDQLVPSRQLAGELGVSRHTVKEMPFGGLSQVTSEPLSSADVKSSMCD